MRVLVTGGHGQLGRAIVRRGAARGDEVHALGRAALEICSAEAAATIAAVDPEVVINAAAYTAVDRAEADAERAFAVNATGAANLAAACAAQRRTLLQLSTDYVFDGTQDTYREDDPVAPLGVYGASKAAGEVAVRARGGTVVRTSWLFGEGGPSFVHTMLRLAAERPVLRVVADQHGCPTWADDLADALLVLGARHPRGERYHVCGDGPTTWHGFALAIIDEARRHRALACEQIAAITTAEYPTPARRPLRAILDTARLRALGIAPPSWRTGLAQVVAQALSSG